MMHVPWAPFLDSTQGRWAKQQARPSAREPLDALISNAVNHKHIPQTMKRSHKRLSLDINHLHDDDIKNYIDPIDTSNKRSRHLSARECLDELLDITPNHTPPASCFRH